MLSRWLGPDLQGPTAPALSGVEGLVAVAAAVVIAWLAAHVTARVARIAFQRLIGGTEVAFTAPIAHRASGVRPHTPRLVVRAAARGQPERWPRS